MNAERFTSDQENGRISEACAALTGAEGQRLLGLLAEEEDRHIDLRNARTVGLIDMAKGGLGGVPYTSRSYSTNQMVS